jgi:hypothetical protein
MRTGLGMRFAIVCAFFALFLCVYVTSCEVRAAERFSQVQLYRTVLCPVEWHYTTSQRYDTRDRSGKITDWVWVTNCF